MEYIPTLTPRFMKTAVCMEYIGLGYMNPRLYVDLVADVM